MAEPSRSCWCGEPHRWWLLDLCSGAGGAAEGYHRAGFGVVGLDKRPQPHYPYEFHQGDALHREDWPAGPFHAVHASPVCKLYSVSTVAFRRNGAEYPNQIPAVRTLLNLSGLPYVIENVPRAPLRPDFRLCGCMFGLRVDAADPRGGPRAEVLLIRERWFETGGGWHGFDLRAPCYHRGRAVSVAGHGDGSWSRDVGEGQIIKIADRRRLMGIGWMNRDELSDAVPPDYTQYIGDRLRAHLEAA